MISDTLNKFNARNEKATEELFKLKAWILKTQRSITWEDENGKPRLVQFWSGYLRALLDIINTDCGTEKEVEEWLLNGKDDCKRSSTEDGYEYTMLEAGAPAE